jgi:midasin
VGGRQGRWILIEDMDLAPLDILASLVPLLESGALYLAPRDAVVHAAPGFQLLATRSTQLAAGGGGGGGGFRRESAGMGLVEGLCTLVRVDDWPLAETAAVAAGLFPSLAAAGLADRLVRVFAALVDPRPPAGSPLARVRFPRRLTKRDLFKLCARVAAALPAAGGGFLTEQQRELVLRDAVDCTCAMLPAAADRLAVAGCIGDVLDVAPERAAFLMTSHKPAVSHDGAAVCVGRVVLHAAGGGDGRLAGKLGGGSGAAAGAGPFCGTVTTMQLLEAVGAAVAHGEPVLLTGETGTGKTSAVQHLAAQVGRRLVVVNLNQQTDSSDLLGGFKPVEMKQLVQPLMDELLQLLPKVTSEAKNASFIQTCREKFEARQWKALLRLMRQAVALVDSLDPHGDGDDASGGGGGEDGGGREGSDRGKRKANSRTKGRRVAVHVRQMWRRFAGSVEEVGRKAEAIKGRFAFSFVDGVVVKALREGHWLLLDEINLAPAELLERLCGLLEGRDGSIAVTERGDVSPVERHPDFRLFACMNPPTDVGKKDLPLSLRTRFTEIFVDEVEKESELREIVLGYMRDSASLAYVDIIVQFYLQARQLTRGGDLFDGGNQRVHYNLRSLARVMQYAAFMQPQGYTFERALMEGVCMTFATQLHPACQPLMEALIVKHLSKDAPRTGAPGRFRPGECRGHTDEWVCIGQAGAADGMWMRKGPDWGRLAAPNLVLTKSCQLYLRNMARAAAPHKYPILLQGPTSAGKTSMIEYLAAVTGHCFVRINNHAHTDVQEYLGAYVSDEHGRLVFQEGPLVAALRGGHWLVLDELNLAPSEVLEMLNRLLDDNRELLIPETQETVRPHAHFVLFATQNPAGDTYGGRKVLSRAFRNRFLEVHVDDIPHEELKEMIEKRCKVAPSRAEKIVHVMQELHRRRQCSNVFAGRKAFVTPRDLFRWADRAAAAATDSYQDLACQGYMLLAEGLRRQEERDCVRDVLQATMKAALDVDALYACGCREDVQALAAQMQLDGGGRATGQDGDERMETIGDDEVQFEGLVKTKSAVRLMRLVGRCLRFAEPVLLVGETGTGKTSVCQAFARCLGMKLHMVNCHQNTETADLIGGYRPVRGKETAAARLRHLASSLVSLLRAGCSGDASLTSQDGSDEAAARAQGLGAAGDDALAQAAEACRTGDVAQMVQAAERTWGDAEQWLCRLEAAQQEEARGLVADMRREYGAYRALFRWYDGPLVTAMRNGDMLLIDEISLAEDSVVERLNSVLEPGRTLTIAEKGGEVVRAHPNFRVVATMNPGGDFGKKVLSLALRNRFTEVWVDAVTDLDDIARILASHLALGLAHAGCVDVLIRFWKWFIERDGGLYRRLLSLRDLLAWAKFINLMDAQGLTWGEALLHGACMVLLDGLGIGDGSSDARALATRRECFDFLLAALPPDARAALAVDAEHADLAPKGGGGAAADAPGDDGRFGAAPFWIARGAHGEGSSFNTAAPTTGRNMRRVLRGMQLSKPILLEGSPGVGKTSLVQALAAMSGHRLVRINLSDQTDMMDLLGTDLPVHGGSTAQFEWCDGVFLQALKAGDWVRMTRIRSMRLG